MFSRKVSIENENVYDCRNAFYKKLINFAWKLNGGKRRKIVLLL